MKKYALISVYDKTDISKLALELYKKGYKIISTAKTGESLKQAEIPFILATEITNNPKILKDCIQTISFHIPAGILFNRNNKKHLNEIKNYNIKSIDVVVCNFPPIKQSVKTIADFNIHNVDVGGPLMVKSAATNYKDVLVVVDINEYSRVISKLKNNKNTLDFRKEMAIKAYKYCASYDLQLVNYLNGTI